MAETTTSVTKRRRVPAGAPGFVAAFVVLFALLGTWSLSTPAMSAPDEVFHARWARAVAGFDWETTPTDSPIGEVDFVATPASLARELPDCYYLRPGTSAACAPGLGDDETIVEATTSFSSYPPLYYATVGWPLALRSDDAGFRAARLVAAAVSAVLLAGAFAVTAAARGAFTTVGLALAVSPMAIYLGGVLNSSGLEISAAVLAWAAAVSLAAGPTRRGDVIALAVGTIALVFSRPVSPALALVVIGTAFVLATPARRHELRGDRSVRGALAAIAVAIAAAATWVIVHDTSSALLGVGEPDVTRDVALRRSLGLLPARLEEAVGFFGWLDAPSPSLTRWTWLIVAAAMIAVATVSAQRWSSRIAVLAPLVAATGLLTVIDLQNYADVGFIAQARYALPLLVGAPLIAGRLLDEIVPADAARRVSSVALAATAVALAVAHWQLLRRYVHGIIGDGALVPWGSDGWQPPLPGLVLMVLSIAATGGWWWIQQRVVTSDDQRRSHRRDQVEASTER